MHSFAWLRQPVNLFAATLLALSGSSIAAQQAAKAVQGAEHGRQIFEQNCSFCHGPDANGGAEGPSLVRSSLVRHDEDGNLIGTVIRNGRPDKGMPQFSFSSEQIAAVVAFLHAQVAASDSHAAGLPSENYSLKLLLTGNAAEGKTYFFGAGGCSGCHSPTGDLAHIAKKYAPVDLQARFLYPAKVAETAVVSSSSGERITGKLEYLDAFTVAVTDRNGWYHSWPRESVRLEIHDPLAAHRELLHKYTQADMHNLFAYLETLK